jgi:hypothetical protein
MPAPKPDHYASLDAALDRAWTLLQAAVTDRASNMRTPVLATKGRDGAPAARTVILRAVDKERRSVHVYTDARSAKVKEIYREPRVEIVFHHTHENVQVRVAGRATMRAGDPQDREAWAAQVPPVRRAYMGAVAPGTPAPAPTGGFPAMFEDRLPSAEESETAFENFAVIAVAVERLEWLYLNPAGHRRAVFTWPGGTRKAGWVVP